MHVWSWVTLIIRYHEITVSVVRERERKSDIPEMLRNTLYKLQPVRQSYSLQYMYVNQNLLSGSQIAF